MNPIYKFQLNRNSNNLLNPEEVIEGLLNENTGQVSEDSSYLTSDFMPVKAYYTYHLVYKDNTGISIPVIVFYDADKNYLSGSLSVSSASVPQNASYARVSVPSSYKIKDYSFSLSSYNFVRFPSLIAHPVYRDDLNLVFEQETNQQFFRKKLSGKLTFLGEDFKWINSMPVDFQFILDIFISYDNGETWEKYWAGTFWKTDCEFNLDDKSVVVKPNVKDEYIDVLAGLEKEYDVITLAPEILPIRMDKRPMIQVYVPGQSVIGCFLSGMWWEQECNAISDPLALVSTYHFSLNKRKRIVYIQNQTGSTPNVTGAYIEISSDPVTHAYTCSNREYSFIFDPVTYETDYCWKIVRESDGTLLFSYYSPKSSFVPTHMVLGANQQAASGNVSVDTSYIEVYSRFVCDTDYINGVATYAIPSGDICPDNRNYHRVIGYHFPDTIEFSTNFTTTPTQWGIRQPGIYYQKPYVLGVPEWYPVSRSAWGSFSIWFSFSPLDELVEQSGRKEFTLRHTYPLDSVISRLLEKVAPGIKHEYTPEYSEFLYSLNNPLIPGIEQRLFISPKSNLIVSGYDQPAQKAPVTLKQVMDMLKDCFRCYWYIEDGKFKIEQIEFFNNGGSYYGQPVIGIDLTQQKVSRNNKKWSFATSKFTYEKPEMTARYQFGWMDDVTTPFNGYPINIDSRYVNLDKVEETKVAQFTSDVDYILLNPSEISNDGFVLLAAKRDIIYRQQESITFSRLAPYDLDFTGNGLPIYLSFNIAGGPGGSIYMIYFIDSNGNSLGDDIKRGSLTPDGENVSVIGVEIPSGTTKIRFYAVHPINLINPQGAVTNLIIYQGYKLPYYRYDEPNGTQHYLQNGYVSFAFLQKYYAYDMPAYNYTINGEEFYALGIKKLKTQKLKFPCFRDPNLVQLIKTEMGNGKIKKISLNLSSRNADASLSYDTE